MIVEEIIFSKDKLFIFNISDKYFSQSLILLIISSGDFSGLKSFIGTLYISFVIYLKNELIPIIFIFKQI